VENVAIELHLDSFFLLFFSPSNMSTLGAAEMMRPEEMTHKEDSPLFEPLSDHEQEVCIAIVSDSLTLIKNTHDIATDDRRV
jgi:hypothetical protein